MLPIIMLTTSFISAPLPAGPRKKDCAGGVRRGLLSRGTALLLPLHLLSQHSKGSGNVRVQRLVAGGQNDQLAVCSHRWAAVSAHARRGEG